MMQPIPKTLMVTWGFPPVMLGSSQIAAGLANQFSRAEMAIAAERWPGMAENEWSDLEGIKPSVHFIHQQWPWKFKKSVRLLVWPVVFARLLHVSRKTGAKQIFAMFPDEYYLFASWLASRLLRLPLFIYLHNTYLENRRGIKRLFAAWFQSRVFRDARTIFVMSEGMREYLSPRYPGFEFVPLPHTFDVIPNPLERPPPLRKNFRMAFMGSLNRSNEDAFSRVSGILRRFPECSFTTYSGNAEADFKAMGLVGQRVTHTRVAFDQVVDALREYDLLFLPHGFHGGLSAVEYETIFPTRTIPYLLSGIPIVAHSPPQAFLTRWLRQHDCAEIVDQPDEQALINAVQRLIDNPQRCQELSRNAQAAALQYHVDKVVRELRRFLAGAATAPVQPTKHI